MHQRGWLLTAGVLGLLLASCLGAGARHSPATPATTLPATATTLARPSATPQRTPAPSATRLPPTTPPPSPTVAPVARATAVLAYIRQLAEGIGPRPGGSQQERQAAELIAGELGRFGLETQLQPFEVPPTFGRDILKVTGPSERAVPAAPLQLTGLGAVSGELVAAGLGRPEDFPAGGIKGKVALMERGQIPFEAKVQNATAAGAVGAVIYNNQPGLFGGTLQSPARIPALGIAQAEGQSLQRQLAEGAVTVTMNVVAKQSQNVVGILNKGRSQIVVVGGHYDTVPATGGANDNTSGTATVLVLAREAAGRSYPFELRFIAFGSEELGLVGSSRYVESLPEAERTRVIAMLDFDALGSGANLEMEGSDALMQRARTLGDARGIVLKQSQFVGGSSDHQPFLDAKIPALFISASDLSRIHTPQDTMSALDQSRLEEAVTLGLDLLDSLARGP